MYIRLFYLRKYEKITYSGAILIGAFGHLLRKRVALATTARETDWENYASAIFLSGFAASAEGLQNERWLCEALASFKETDCL